MRRKERQTTRERAYEIFDQSPYATLSMVDEKNQPYAVMVSPIRIDNDIYIHCDIAGKKLDCLKAHPEVCLSGVSTMQNAPSFYTVDYASCIIEGIAQLVEDKDEKHEALYRICERYAASNLAGIHDKIERSLAHVCIVKIHMKTISGKENPLLRR